MAVDIQFNLDLNNDPNNERTVGELREEFKRLEEQVDKTKQGTDEYNQAVKQLGQVQGELEKVDRAIEAMNPERKAQVIGDAVSGMSGGFQAAVASAELFGVENEAVLESLQRVNAVMAITEGITAFSEKIPAMKTLIATMPQLQRALKGARVGFQGLSTATKALGIGLLVSAVALLVTHWDDLEGIITDLIPGLEDTGDLFGKLTDGAIAVGKAILQYLATPMKAIIQLMSGDFSAAKDTVVEGFNIIGNTAEEFEKRQAERGLQTTIENLEKKLELEQAYGNDTTELEQEIFEKKKKLYDEDSEEYKELLREKQLADANAARQRREREEREQQERLERQRTYEQELEEARKNATDGVEDEIIEEEIDVSVGEMEEGEELIFVNGKILPRSVFEAMVDTGKIAKLQAIEAELATAEEGTAKYIRLEKQRADAAAQIAEAEADAKIATFERTGQALGQLSRIAGEQTAIGKALGVAQATIDTYVGANKALAQGGIFGIVSAAAVIATGLANVKQIISTKVPSIQGQPLGTPASAPAARSAGISTPLPQGASRRPPSFNDNGINTVNTVASNRDRDLQNRPIKAVVVETDITETQNSVNEIESQASF